MIDLVIVCITLQIPVLNSVPIEQSSDSNNSHSSDNDGDHKMLITVPGEAGADPLTIATAAVTGPDDPSTH